jgi:hypothetical protein
MWFGSRPSKGFRKDMKDYVSPSPSQLRLAPDQSVQRVPRQRRLEGKCLKTCFYRTNYLAASSDGMSARSHSAAAVSSASSWYSQCATASLSPRRWCASTITRHISAQAATTQLPGSPAACRAKKCTAQSVRQYFHRLDQHGVARLIDALLRSQTKLASLSSSSLLPHGPQPQCSTQAVQPYSKNKLQAFWK